MISSRMTLARLALLVLVADKRILNYRAPYPSMDGLACSTPTSAVVHTDTKCSFVLHGNVSDAPRSFC